MLPLHAEININAFYKPQEQNLVEMEKNIRKILYHLIITFFCIC